MFARLLGAAAIALAFASTAPASPISYDVSTGQGVGAAGSADPIYTLLSPAGTAMITVPNNAWTATFPPGSRWISNIRNSQTGTSAPSTTFTFETTFDLTGLVAGTAGLNLTVAADNAVRVLLNGNVLGTFGMPNTNTGYTGTANFATVNPAFFNAGINTLTFQVRNGMGSSGNPVGLRVSGEVNAEVIPEPATLTAFGFGLAGLGAYIRRRKSVTA